MNHHMPYLPSGFAQYIPMQTAYTGRELLPLPACSNILFAPLSRGLVDPWTRGPLDP